MSDVTVQPKSDSNERVAVRQVYVAAFNALMRGRGIDTVKQELMARGVDERSASAIANNVSGFIRQFRQVVRAAGLKNAGIGALWCIGGTVVTVLTIAAAAHGGTFIVAWGAILFGAIQAVMGLVRSLRQPTETDLIAAFSL